ncbi:uncharacterized protein B4U80_02054, partial [Leptotrombidium deliense]
MIEKKLESLIEKDIIYKIGGTSIVTVSKETGEVRLCADFKKTFNQQAEFIQHQFPSFNEVLYKLQDAIVFSKSEVKQA